MMSTLHRDASIRMGGAALVVAALGFIGVFTYLAVQFNYPDVLDAPASSALPGLLAMGNTGRAVWALYGLLPLLLVPASIGASVALRSSDEGGMRLAVVFATVAALTMMLGLLRWPSIQWELAAAYSTADQSSRSALAAVFNGLNRYLGTYLGEFVGELSLNAFFFLSARAMWRGNVLPRWVAGLGLASGLLGWIAMWRNVTDVVAPIAALNNAVLPLWMMVFGAGLFFTRRPPSAVSACAERSRGSSPSLPLSTAARSSASVSVTAVSESPRPEPPGLPLPSPLWPARRRPFSRPWRDSSVCISSPSRNGRARCGRGAPWSECS
jgi:hypothetical protein